MSDTLAYHVGSNVPGYSPEGDITCWDTPAEGRDALLSLMLAHVDYLGDACDDDDVNPQCDDCDVYAEAKRITEETQDDTRTPGWEQGLTVQLPTGRALPLAFWLTPVAMDHAAECEPLGD